MKRHFTEKRRANISASLQGKRNPRYGKPHTRGFTGRHHTKEVKAKIRAARQVNWQDPEYRAKMSALRKAIWQNPEHAKKVFRSVQPNKAELKLQGILHRYFPNEWRYVGNRGMKIGGLYPDFLNINGKKQVIELFGERWHPLFDVAKKKECYRQYGFRVAIIWEDELEDEERLVKVFKRKFRQNE